MSRRREFRQSLKLATPIVIAQIGLMMMNMVDTMIVGRVDSATLAGVGAGSSLFWMMTVPGIGVLMALDTLISQAVGAGDQVSRDRYLHYGHITAVALSLVITPIVYLMGSFYDLTGATPDVAAVAGPFLQIMSINVPLILLTTVYQRYWQARNVALPLTLIVLAANVLNYYANIALVLGEWGFPRLESIGSAYATTLSRGVILLAIVIYSVCSDDSPLIRARWQDAWQQIRKLGINMIQRPILKIGLPAGAQMLLEVMAFSVATTLASRLGATDAAAHHIVLMIASFTFMFPMGLSAATAVLVGQGIGANQPHAAIRSGWYGIGQGAAVMIIWSAILFVWPGQLLGLFTTDPQVIARGQEILFLAAIFQLCDGLQVTASGALRGIGKTRGPMLANLIGHYPIGLTVAIIACFYWNLGLYGLWAGLSTGLFAVTAMCLAFWTRASRLLVKV